MKDMMCSLRQRIPHYWVFWSARCLRKMGTSVNEEDKNPEQISSEKQ